MIDRFGPTFGEACNQILLSESSPKQKGDDFEDLLVYSLPNIAETEIQQAWRWADVPEDIRSRAWPRSTRTDIGVDIVALRNMDLLAIQAKCYQKDQIIGKSDVDSFLAATGGVQGIDHRWIVTTCKWTKNLLSSTNNCSFLHAPSQWGHIKFNGVRGPVTHDLDTLQTEAFNACVERLRKHDRGQLIMACGTGKTLVSQRIAEEIVPDGGLVIYATPSIGLTAQSRREWLREARRPIQTVVVCSDQAAGQSDGETGYTSEVEAPVSTDPAEISRSVERARKVLDFEGHGFTVVFTTYQSMDKVCEAQALGMPVADLVIADEAHKTAGIIKGDAKVFQKVHHDLKAQKRLYQTATPRIYSRRSRKKITDNLITSVESEVKIIDMSDDRSYGPEFYKLRFTDALKAPIEERRLCDYRVVVVLLEDTLSSPATDGTKPVLNTAMGTRMAGLSLVMQGADGLTIHEGRQQKTSIQDLNSCIAFCNQLKRAQWARKTIADERLNDWAIKKSGNNGHACALSSGYLDGKSDAAERFMELENLRTAKDENKKHVTTNVKVLSEGINVPALDAICFLEERSSEIDIVQAVGRVMRKPKDGNKEFGYIIVPIMMNPQLEFEETLSAWNHDWRVLGQVLRSLRAHDERIETDLRKQVIVTTQPPGGSGGGGDTTEPTDFWGRLHRGDYDNLVPAVMELSGLKPDVVEETNLIKAAVDAAARSLIQETGLGQKLRAPAGIEDVKDKPDHRACAGSALLLTNALLMYQRICETTENGADLNLTLTPLSEIKSSQKPEIELIADWKKILEVDYRPIFEPALEVMYAARMAGETAAGMRQALRTLARHCEEIAGIYARMGMDHAGELFQAAMDHPEADGAYYTLTPGAMLLAELACDQKAPENDSLWKEADTWKDLTIVDPACGSGTLLTAMATAIKRRAKLQGASEEELRELHATLVEESLTGLDVNPRAIQIAASQLAIPTAGYQLKQMGLWTMPRRTEDTPPKARLGALELLKTRRDGTPRADLLEALNSEEGQQIDIAHEIRAEGLRERLCRTRICISNPPYSNSAKQGGDLTPEARRYISERKKRFRKLITKSDPGLEGILNPNSVRPWFTVLMEELADREQGVVAKIMPTTACTAIDATERVFLAERFDIALILTIHDFRKFNWSAETDITESMLVAGRRNGDDQPTRFISLARKPKDAKEVQDLHQRILEHDLGKLGRECEWPRERMAAGDWSPAVWFHPELAEAARTLEELADENTAWTRIGKVWDVNTTKQIVGQEKWDWCEEPEAEVSVIKGAGMDAQLRIRGAIDGWARRAKKWEDKKERVLRNLTEKAGCLLITNTQDSGSARLNTVAVREKAVGYTWTPVRKISKNDAEAIAVWNNSTLGRIAMRRLGSRKLIWPFYQPQAISQMVVPVLTGGDGEAVLCKLREAFVQTQGELVPQYRDGVLGVREIWDDAVSEATGLDRSWIRDCAKLLSEEPTIRGNTA